MFVYECSLHIASPGSFKGVVGIVCCLVTVVVVVVVTSWPVAAFSLIGIWKPGNSSHNEEL